MPLRDYLNIMSERTEKTRQQIEDLRAANPEQAAREDERMKLELIKQQEEYINKRVQLGIAEKNRAFVNASPDAGKPGKRSKVTSPSSANRDANIVVSNLVSPKGNKKIKKDEISEININKYKEADFVGRETIDLINKEAEVSEIDASHFNKTDRFGSKAHMLTEE